MDKKLPYVYIDLSFDKDFIDVDKISELTGLKPTKTWENCWSHHTNGEFTEDINMCLSNFLNTIEGSTQEIRKYCRENDVEMRIYVVVDLEDLTDIFISAENIERLAEFGCWFGFD